ncbi:MAG: NgoFVII family restriction endonuclease [Candidatus Latescibacteria bacterium]|nr:NgoFVII family restriction endonuclease [Candidatus Latescibacterota bacterium]
MPRIFDNIEQPLLPALQETMEVSDRADFCVGYFNLRGWKAIDEYVERWHGGEGHCCRLLVGMHRSPQEEFRLTRSLVRQDGNLDNQTAIRLKKRLAEEFRDQLATGAPSNQDEAGLRRLSEQIKSKKVVVKLFLRDSLHAKLYMLFRPDPVNPSVGYLGSSNLTQSGLSGQGELNVDVLDHDACAKLAKWFEDRWQDKWCIDISDELAQIIDESWAGPRLIPPYHIYIKMAYHLSQEARAGLTEFRIPKDFGNKLLDFQVAAVKIAAHHLNKRGGVIIGDVVGLGKTLMATALARVFEDDHGVATLIICPKNLVPMWEDYRDEYRLRARVLSVSQAINKLPDMRRYRLVVIDESHNLRNREGKRYRAIQEYIRENESKCILLSATPYNKTYQDLSNQIRLFVHEDEDLGIRPERLLREIGETEFIRRHQADVRSLAAFEQSEYADDWRELMRLYLVRRTRSFIQENYATLDQVNGRRYLTFEDGSRSYFPVRVPRTVGFDIDNQYARLFDDNVVSAINGLELPRYGLANYLTSSADPVPSSTEDRILQDLSRAGRRLMGFCRTNLFKRLESSGHSFLLSVERHVLRNFIFLHAIENGLDLPIGTTDAGLLDPQSSDADPDGAAGDDSDDDGDGGGGIPAHKSLRTEEEFRRQAARVYDAYSENYRRRFRWLSPRHFDDTLREALVSDAKMLREILEDFGEWRPSLDAKLGALQKILNEKHPREKVLVFTQFADTVQYLERHLKDGGVERLSGVTGDSADPTRLAWRFSPKSNEKGGLIAPEDELRVLVATDVLSEGQNLQDCAIVVNYDLPWAIIRLIQRAGRVDRIGQSASNILCYSFLPAEGIERLIRLRARVRQRLDQNAEVVGTDEAFFEDDDTRSVVDLYNEQTGILDGDDDAEVDLASYAFQIWKNATTADPSLEKKVEQMPDVVHSSRACSEPYARQEGILVYMRTIQDNDALAWMDRESGSVTESHFDVLRAAECKPNTPALPRHERHHDLVGKAAERIAREENQVGGQLGRPSSARFRTYERLKNYAERVEGTLFDTQQLRRAIDEIYRYPLRQSAVDALNRQLRSGISDEDLASVVIGLWEDGLLCVVHEDDEPQEPRIICSMGLINYESREKTRNI